MGAQFNFMTAALIPEAELREKFIAAQAKAGYEHGHGYSGSWAEASGLSVLDEFFESRDEAEDWLDEHCQKWQDALAVQYSASDGPRWAIGALCSS
jgi:hypothetical protein